MLRNNLSYPYPMLRKNAIDYENDTLNTTLTVAPTINSYIIEINITTSNSNINKLLKEGKVIKGAIIKSSSVWYRKFFDLTNTNIIKIPSSNIYGKVEIIPCIIAKENLTNYYSDDFSSEFKYTNIKINSGEMIAIGDEYSFDALLENDILKNTSSIFEFAPYNEKIITYDMNEDKIIINLPQEIYNEYSTIVNTNLSPKSVLNSTLVFPVLLSIVTIIKTEGELYEDKKWYKTIMKTIELKHKDKLIKGLNINGDIEDPLQVAQSLTSGLLENAIHDISRIILSIGGEE